jgi:hypothetical protein
MHTIEDMELINRFVEDSLKNEELQLFNKKYRDDPEFAKLANSYFDMSIAIKAVDQFSKTKLKDRKDNQRYIVDYKWVASIAASLVLIITFSFYAIHLRKENRLLFDDNHELSDHISKLKQEIETNQKNTGTTTLKPIEPEKGTDGIDQDQRTFSTILALNKIVESNVNKNITRNSDDVAHIFPIQSKLIDKNEAYLSVLSTNQLSKAKKFRLIDYSNNDTIFRIDNISKEEISLNKSGIQIGKKYYWVITNQNGSIESGSITVIPESERKMVKAFTLKTGNDYLEAFIYYYKNAYYFDAQSVLKKAVCKYHNEELFTNLLKTLHNTKTL